MDVQERIYHEVILAHQLTSWVYDHKCMCGWVMTLGFDTHAEHLASMIANWLEHNFVFHDRI